MTSSQIQTFMLVCEYLNFTEASTRLYITPSAVSRQMSHLEEELEADLFIRNNNSVSLTIAGRELYTGLQRIYPYLIDLFSHVSNISKGIEGNLRIGLLLDQCIDDIIKQAFNHVRKKNPHVNISIKRMDFRALQEHLLNGSLDVIITLFQTQPLIQNMNHYIYLEDTPCIAIPHELCPNLPSAFSEEEFYEKIPSLHLLQPSLNTFDQAIRGQLSHLNSDTQKIENYVHYTDDFDSITSLVSAGLNSSIVNETNLLKNDPNIAMIPTPFFAKIGKGIFWMKHSTTPIIEDFIDFFV